MALDVPLRRERAMAQDGYLDGWEALEFWVIENRWKAEVDRQPRHNRTQQRVHGNTCEMRSVGWAKARLRAVPTQSTPSAKRGAACPDSVGTLRSR